MNEIGLHFGTFVCVLCLTCGKGSQLYKYVSDTLNTCECEGEPSSLVQCTTICAQTQNCKGISFNRDNDTCCVCSTIEVTGQTSDSGNAFYRATNEHSCDKELVNEIPDAQITASSIFNIYHGTNRARLNTPQAGLYQGAWSAGAISSNEYIQARFTGIKEIVGVATQGRTWTADFQCVTSYQVSYSIDCVTFVFVVDDEQEPKIFPGNDDQNTIVWNDLQESILAVCVRIYTTTFINYPSLRFGIKGCDFSP